MKAFSKIVISCAAAAAAALTLSACGDPAAEGKVKVYMPDGAPALAMAQLMTEEPDLGREVSYNVVDASAVQTYVSDGTADICVLPVNAAAKVAGDGEEYTMLGVVTHGNLFMLASPEEAAISSSDELTTLVGKTVGCIQLQSFVGTVIKAILTDNGIPYQVVQDSSKGDADKVNLVNIANPANEISPSAPFDYMIAAEPVVTAKTKSGALKVAGDLQELYGGGGYPQAVMVAKNSLIQSDGGFISDFIDEVEESAEWILSADPSVIAGAVNGHGGANTLNANNLTADTIRRCAISFTIAASARDDVLAFIQKYNAVTSDNLTLSDAFFYGYEAEQ